ncbi:MAG: fibrobacter succinogenes major paralogous domain-containing protein [Bacteroidales bacterium]|nr:fibrobacter succinogenes major paralogous domain-containing protein [Bacteroidales bacterium]
MKKLLSFLAVVLISTAAFAQSVTLTFTAKDAANHYVQLNRVVITNLTKSWQEIIYWPDTTLTMQNGTGINDVETFPETSLQLSQNNPNPFTGTTEVSLMVAEGDEVMLDIADVNGKIVGTYRMRPQAGIHQFRITLSTLGTYVMTARQDGQTSSIKMVCNGGGDGNRIEYQGIVGANNHSPLQTKSDFRGTTTQPFNFGDQMEYVGYATINGTEAESQRIMQAQGASQTFTLQFTQTQHQLPTVTTSAVSNITSSSAACGGNVTSDGGATVTARGVCLSTSQNPTVSDWHTSSGSGTGSFSNNINGLEAGTTYYVRAYATNSQGTSYGIQRSFTTQFSVPTVTTNTVSSITPFTATCGGNVTSDGGATVTARGVCWSTSQNPTVSSGHTTDGSGIGSFTSNITGLAAGTTYYVRAYATNSQGTSYGTQQSFTTQATFPTVTTSFLSNITSSTAICGYSVTTSGGSSVTAHGVCWSTSQNPTLSNNHTTDGSGTGSFSSSLTGLTDGTTYYVRAYATNSQGTAYGNELTFSTVDLSNDGQPCPGTATVTDIDNNTYNTVQIGNQCWMKENLRTTHYANGVNIPMGSTYSNTSPYRYSPDNNSSNVSTYGYLYNWPAVMHGASSSASNPSGVQGICPTGWHVPSDAEWTQLTDYVGNQTQYRCDSIRENIAKVLASTTGWNSSSNTCAVGNNPSTNNATGFSALPAGYYNHGNYGGLGNVAQFWTTTDFSGDSKYGRDFFNSYAIVDIYFYEKYRGFSVRCVRDALALPTVTTNTVSNITATSATCGGDVTYDGGATITARGVCWNTSQNPTVSNSHTTDGSGTGSFTSSLTGLTDGTTYYVRAYATNSQGTAYGNELSFTPMSPDSTDGQPCPGAATVTDIDNNTYNTVKIGNQCWMKENLRTTRYANGVNIPMGSTDSWTDTDPYRYVPDNNSSNVSTYGYLYNWPAVMHGASSSSANPSGVQGICPNGWHVPSDSEWTQLTNYVGSQTQYQCNNSSNYIAKALASTTGWNSDTYTCAVGNNPGTNNATGFSALPAGNYCYGNCYNFGGYAKFWSATESYGNAYTRTLYYTSAGVEGYSSDEFYGFSVRCLRD